MREVLPCPWIPAWRRKHQKILITTLIALRSRKSSVGIVTPDKVPKRKLLSPYSMRGIPLMMQLWSTSCLLKKTTNSHPNPSPKISCHYLSFCYRNNCVNCGVQFGDYHCNICNLWMANDERPYHCQDCGFCRVGGAENFQHCHDCGMCIDKSLYSNHNCKSGKYKSNCPVCQEFLFSSRSASHEMPCGHAIHWECFRQLAAHDSRCPVCKKTAETRERMMPTWNAMAAGVALQPVPPELARVVNITCNDCEKADDARAWHFLGVQCRNCSSFNTVVDRIIMSGEEAHEFLETLQTRSDLIENEDGSQRISRRRINRRRSLF